MLPDSVNVTEDGFYFRFGHKKTDTRCEIAFGQGQSNRIFCFDGDSRLVSPPDGGEPNHSNEGEDEEPEEPEPEPNEPPVTFFTVYGEGGGTGLLGRPMASFLLQGPSASFTFEPAGELGGFVTGRTLRFDASLSYDPDGDELVEFVWEFT